MEKVEKKTKGDPVMMQQDHFQALTIIKSRTHDNGTAFSSFSSFFNAKTIEY